ncbi:hypothetical protein EVAR_66231_1 [Eumeta japonica]|uniref:Uncharacterized protein n=1 Tax=Eumeta variegata TaxID=151549 RepID=A0A4C1ZSR8_EUMVA|nr:hypothetical protein EVAR_66231_1 [Eumeta japonica]
MGVMKTIADRQQISRLTLNAYTLRAKSKQGVVVAAERKERERRDIGDWRGERNFSDAPVLWKTGDASGMFDITVRAGYSRFMLHLPPSPAPHTCTRHVGEIFALFHVRGSGCYASERRSRGRFQLSSCVFENVHGNRALFEYCKHSNAREN